MVAVLGISESSKADLLAQLDRLGTNLLQVAPGQSFMGEDAVLPEAAPAMLRRVSGVQSVAATASVAGVTVRRSPYVDEDETGGINVAAADPSLRSAIGATLAHGTFLNAATGRYPAVVLGAEAANTLGIADTGSRVWLGGRWFTVIGILDPFTLAPQLDTAALIGFDVAESLFDADGTASTVFVRVDQDRVEAVRDAARRDREPAEARRRSRSRARPTPSRRARRPRPRSRRSSSGSARSRCSSAASGSPT